jgi:hypothetical protein
MGAVAVVLLQAPASERHFRNERHVRRSQALPRRIGGSWTIGKWSKPATSSRTLITLSSPRGVADMAGDACAVLGARTLDDSAGVESLRLLRSIAGRRA